MLFLAISCDTFVMQLHSPITSCVIRLAGHTLSLFNFHVKDSNLLAFFFLPVFHFSLLLPLFLCQMTILTKRISKLIFFNNKIFTCWKNILTGKTCQGRQELLKKLLMQSYQGFIVFHIRFFSSSIF